MANDPAAAAAAAPAGAAPTTAPNTSISDAWRFDYRLTGWARDSHNAAVYCVAFCGKACGEGAEEEEEAENENEFPLDRVFASVGSRRITVYLAPALPPPSTPSSDPSASTAASKDAPADAAAGAAADEAEKQHQQLQQRLRLPFSVLQTYVDAAADEEFYVCRWARRRQEEREKKKKKTKREKDRMEEVHGDREKGKDKKEREEKEKEEKKTPPHRLPLLLPLLLAGGKRGVLRVIDPKLGGLSWTARGHGRSINDIAVHPTVPSLALTASRDQSVRLWNLEARCCAAQFAGGDGAHVAEVLSVDWHPLDPFVFASSGYDSSVKVWSLEGVKEAVEASFEHERGLERRRGRFDDGAAAADGNGGGGGGAFAPFAPRIVPSPRFSSQRVHSRVADCIRWLGPGVLLSKTVDDRVLAWSVEGVEGLPCPVLDISSSAGAGKNAAATSAPAKAPAPSSPPPPTLVPRPEEPRVRLLNSLRLSEADDVWFLRFSLDARGETLACGGREGRVCVFDPRRVPEPGGGARRAHEEAPVRRAPRRQVGPEGAAGGRSRERPSSSFFFLLLGAASGLRRRRIRRAADRSVRRRLDAPGLVRRRDDLEV